MPRRLAPILLAALIGYGLTACHRAQIPGPAPGRVSPDQGPVGHVPLGNPPGQPGTIASQIANPFEGDAAAAQEGKALFSSMNCVYCHGANASGLMGPPLNGQGWRYGGTPAEIYNSIHDGRPQGMPAWSASLPPQQIWKIVAYLETLGGAATPATAAQTKLLGPNASTAGPQAADQGQTDAANDGRIAGNARASSQGGH